MSGECNKCGEHCLDCKCSLKDKLESLRQYRRNDTKSKFKHLGIISRDLVKNINNKIIPISSIQISEKNNGNPS